MHPVDALLPPDLVEPLTDEELAAWLHLLHSAGVGREAARRLLARFGSPQAVLDAPVAQRASVIDATSAAALGEPPEGHAQRLANTLAWRRAAANRRVMVLGDTDYPPLLLNTADPPLLLYLAGRAELLSAPSLAIVGSRHATAQGLDHAASFARALSAQGWTIVSGLAAGIDGAAHAGALAEVADGSGSGSGSGSTIAVIGTGLDVVYPRSHKALAQRVAEHGLMVSELALGTPPLAAHFPQRNRLIAGLSLGTLVVEAALRSGSLITARLAAEAGREVMALPGSLLAPQSHGCHALIRQGAVLVESVAQVLEELNALPGRTPGSRSTETPARLPSGRAAMPPGDAPATPDAEAIAPRASADPVLRALGHDPQSLDSLIARCGWAAPALSAHLLTLELDGQVARLPGGLYQRRQAT